MNNPIIIGAGIAGLSAANHLVDNNIKPIIIEADILGRPKVCGEFFSPEAIPFLKYWDLPLIYINQAKFYTPNYNYLFSMPKHCASVSRNIFENSLSNRAIERGAIIYSNTKVINIIPAQDKNDIHYIKLSTGQILETNKLIIATGKIPSWNTKTKLEPEYIGIKAHFKDVNAFNELNMFLINGGYMGITFIDNKTVNVCCLIDQKLFNNFTTPDKLMQQFIDKYKILNNLKNGIQQQDWITCFVNGFGKKIVPNWPNTYFIGDAAATIFPASGNGLTMGLTSGIMAAEHIISNSSGSFKKQWNLRYEKRLYYAKILNALFMNINYAKMGFKIAKNLPFISKILFKLTRE